MESNASRHWVDESKRLAGFGPCSRGLKEVIKSRNYTTNWAMARLCKYQQTLPDADTDAMDPIQFPLISYSPVIITGLYFDGRLLAQIDFAWTTESSQSRLFAFALQTTYLVEEFIENSVLWLFLGSSAVTWLQTKVSVVALYHVLICKTSYNFQPTRTCVYCGHMWRISAWQDHIYLWWSPALILCSSSFSDFTPNVDKSTKLFTAVGPYRTCLHKAMHYPN